MAVMLSGTAEIFRLMSSCRHPLWSPCLSSLWKFVFVTTACSASRIVPGLLQSISVALVVCVAFCLFMCSSFNHRVGS
jgi:hypothetical protein